jgi:hypothetical protein
MHNVEAVSVTPSVSPPEIIQLELVYSYLWE